MFLTNSASLCECNSITIVQISTNYNQHKQTELQLNFGKTLSFSNRVSLVLTSQRILPQFRIPGFLKMNSRPLPKERLQIPTSNDCHFSRLVCSRRTLPYYFIATGTTKRGPSLGSNLKGRCPEMSPHFSHSRLMRWLIGM